MEKITESSAHMHHPTNPGQTSKSAASRRPTRKIYALQLPISERRVLLMIGDLAAIEVSIIIALALWAIHARFSFDSAFAESQAHWFVILPTLWLLLATANDYYDLRVSARVGASLKRLTLIECEALFVYVATFFLSHPGSLPRRFIVYYAALSLALIGLWRATRIFLVGWNGFRRRALIVGAGHEAAVIRLALEEEAVGDYEVIGLAASARDLASNIAREKFLGSGEALPKIVAKYGVTEIIIAYSGDLPDDVFKGLLACYEVGVQVTPMARLYEQVTGRIPIEHLSEQLWTMVLPDEARSLRANLYALWKRLTDVALALIGLLLFAPLLPALALAIKLDSRGPIFYTQVRLGKAGTAFRIIKLRSMVMNAERDSGPQWAKANDNRVTRVGLFLRRSRLDEVPQLISVLVGDMSIIGPRPERPEFVETLAAEIPFYRARLAVKPGLTGWAQVRYRYGNSREDALRKLQYDLYYIRRQSPLMDLVIALKTVGVMLMFQGM